MIVQDAPQTAEQDAIAKDLYGRYDAIISVDDVKVWQFGEKENRVTNLVLRVFPAEISEYKRMKREIRQRISQKFGINRLFIEMEW